MSLLLNLLVNLQLLCVFTHPMCHLLLHILEFTPTLLWILTGPFGSG